MAGRSKSPRQTKKVAISIVGTGRVGLPLALFLADKGHTVYGIDAIQEKVDIISKGVMPFMEEGAPELLKKYINKTLVVSTNFANVAKSKAIILTLGTPVDENMNPSLVQIDRAIDQIKPFLKKGQLL